MYVHTYVNTLTTFHVVCMYIVCDLCCLCTYMCMTLSFLQQNVCIMYTRTYVTVTFSHRACLQSAHLCIFSIVHTVLIHCISGTDSLKVNWISGSVTVCFADELHQSCMYVCKYFL